MDDRDIREAADRDPERALARALKAATACRQPPEPPVALCDIAWRRTAENPSARGRKIRIRDSARGHPTPVLAEIAWAAALTACLVCSIVFARLDTALARNLDNQTVRRVLDTALSAADLTDLESWLGDYPPYAR